jgi:4-hydroxy-4-methyl-2-oxoglutarate aldolase
MCRSPVIGALATDEIQTKGPFQEHLMDKYQINPMPQQIDPALVSRAANVETATIGHIRQLGFADPAIAPMMPATTVIGTAVTLALPGQDSTLLHDVAGRLRPGDVLVIDRLGDHKHACLGGGVACAIKASGCEAVVIDGPATDRLEILDFGLPVWSRGLSPVTTRLYDIGGALNVPISCGGAAVLPGWVVVADDSGVLFMPPDEAPPFIDWALEKQIQEPASHKLIREEGARLGDLTGASAKVAAALES